MLCSQCVCTCYLPRAAWEVKYLHWLGVVDDFAAIWLLNEQEHCWKVFINPPQAAWWVEYICRHGTADWLKSVGEEVNTILVVVSVGLLHFNWMNIACREVNEMRSDGRSKTIRGLFKGLIVLYGHHIRYRSTNTTTLTSSSSSQPSFYSVWQPHSSSGGWCSGD